MVYKEEKSHINLKLPSFVSDIVALLLENGPSDFTWKNMNDVTILCCLNSREAFTKLLEGPFHVALSLTDHVCLVKSV